MRAELPERSDTVHAPCRQPLDVDRAGVVNRVRVEAPWLRGVRPGVRDVRPGVPRLPRSLLPLHLPSGAMPECWKGLLICPWALWLSQVDTVFKHGFEAIYPLQHSGVVQMPSGADDFRFRAS